MGYWLIGLGAASLAGAIVAAHLDPRAAFFLTPLRLWEFVAGGLVALGGARAASRRLRTALAGAGLALILVPAFLYDSKTLFPGIAALPPVLGAMLLIWSGQRVDPKGEAIAADETSVHRALANPASVYLGQASYSLYLWHWPVLAAASYVAFGELTWGQKAIAIAVSFVCAAASLHLVERPVRRARGVRPRRLFYGGAVAALAAIPLFGWAVQETEGWPQRYPELAPLLAEDSFRYGPRQEACAPIAARLPKAIARDLDPAVCRIGPSAPPNGVVAFWGDSHAKAVAPGLVDWAKERGLAVYLITSGVCPPALGYERPSPTKFVDCRPHNQAALELLKRLKIRRVYLLAWWRAYPVEQMIDGVSETAATLKAMGVSATVFEQAPETGMITPTYLFRAAVSGWSKADDLPNTTAPYKADLAKIYHAAEAAGAKRIAIAPIFCGAGERCRVAAPNGAAYFADSHHLSRVGARYLVKRLTAAGALSVGADARRRP